jgi:hypothetical protein
MHQVKAASKAAKSGQAQHHVTFAFLNILILQKVM